MQLKKESWQKMHFLNLKTFGNTTLKYFQQTAEFWAVFFRAASCVN